MTKDFFPSKWQCDLVNFRWIHEGENSCLTFPTRRELGTYRKAGLGAWKMAYSHVAIGLFFLFLSIGGIYRYMGSNQAIASLGLTVMVIVSVKIYHLAEAMGEKNKKFTDRAIAWKQGAVSGRER